MKSDETARQALSAIQESDDMHRTDKALTKPVSALRGGTWTMISRVIIQLVQFAIFIAVARWVDPEAFGLFALVAACVVILDQLATAGWPEYIMQSETDDGGLANALFVAMTCGTAAAFLGIGLALLAGLSFDAPNVVWIALFLSASVAFSATASAYAGVLNRQNRLEAAAVCALLGEIANFAVTIGALYAGLGILALALGRLAASVVWAFAAAISSRLRPALWADWHLVKEMMIFSKHIILTKVLFNLRIYASTFIIGGFVGPAAVGLFRAAQRIVNGFEEIFGEPTRVLSWSLFRTAREGETEEPTDRFDALSQIFFRIQLYCAAPVFIGVAILGKDLIVGLLGDDWSAAGPVLQILALVGLVRISGHASVPILSLAGKTNLLPRVIFVYSLITVVCILVAARYGIVAMALAELVAAILIFFINAYVMRRFADIYWGRILKGCWRILPVLALTIICCLLAIRAEMIEQLHPLLRFFLLSVFILVLYVPAILLIDKSTRSLLGHRFRRSRPDEH